MMKRILLLPLLLLVSCSSHNDKEITASGAIEATEVVVSAKIGGQLLKLLVDEGSSVKQGDTLALIDRLDLDIQLRQTQANAAAVEAQYKLTLRGMREEDIAQAEATYENAKDDLSRMEELFKQNTIAQKQIEDARTRFTVAQQNYEKLKRGSRAEEIEIARARRDQATAQVEAIEKKIVDSHVIAPTAGIITQRAVEEGEDVLPGAALFRISRMEKVHLMIYVSEEELAGVKLGQEADVYIDAYPQKPFSGTVTYISSTAEFTPKNIQTKDDRTKLVFGVKIEVPNPDQSFKPGMPADARLAMEGLKNDSGR